MNVWQWARAQWDRVTAWVLIGLGGLAVVLGWLGVRTEALTQKQIPYLISGGIGGLVLVAIGGVLWLSADLRDEWRKLDAIERATTARASSDGPADDEAAAPARRPRARKAAGPR